MHDPLNPLSLMSSERGGGAGREPVLKSSEESASPGKSMLPCDAFNGFNGLSTAWLSLSCQLVSRFYLPLSLSACLSISLCHSLNQVVSERERVCV